MVTALLRDHHGAARARWIAPEGGATLWWLFAVVSVALTGWLVLGLTRASQEHPIA